jgi:hypothetical protein
MTKIFYMKFLLLLFFLIFLTSSCSMTLPVKGTVQNSDETFQGSATGYLGGSGSLEIISNTGVKYKGNFVYVTSRQGEGVFNCDDGRSGPFEFVSSGTNGTGYGDLGGSRFTFTFGYFN